MRPSRFARRMSAVPCTWRSRSSCSPSHRFHCATFSIVARKPSHTEQVQLAAVTPPARISSNTDRLHREMISPSIRIASLCNAV